MKKLVVPRIQSQRDGRWSGVLLGFNTQVQFNIGNYGCLITSVGNYIGKSPSEVNDILKANQGFVNGGDLVWSKLSSLGLNNVYTSPRYDDAVTDNGIAKMKALIDEGRPLICEIDFNPNTLSEDQHYILVIGYDDSSPDSLEFIAIDPWTGTEISASVYGGIKRMLYMFRAYDKILPFYTPAVSVDDYKKKIQTYFNVEISADNVIKFIEDRKKEINTLNNAIGVKDGIIDGNNKTIDNLNNTIDQLNKDKNILSDELKICQTKVDANADCPAKLLEATKITNQANQNLEIAKGNWNMKEIDYQKKINTLQTRLDAFKSPTKKLVVDIWEAILGKK